MSSTTVYIVNTETVLPDIPHSVGVTNPINASGILLELSPPDFFLKVSVLVCGGMAVDPEIQATKVSSQFPAPSPCSHTTPIGSPEGIARVWKAVGTLRVEDCPWPHARARRTVYLPPQRPRP